MKNPLFITTILVGLGLIVASTEAKAQSSSLAHFLESKYEQGEKVVLLYADKQNEELIETQLDELFTIQSLLHYHKITIVKLPSKLVESDRNYLVKNLRMQPERLNVWVFDDSGSVRFASTKKVSGRQVLATLDKLSFEEVRHFAAK